MTAGIKAGEAYVEIGVRLQALQRGLRRAEAQLAGFAGRTRQMAGALLGAGGLLGLPQLIAARIGASFEDEMAKVRAVTRASADDFAKLNAEAERLGASTSFTATEVASAMKELGKAGFDTNQILASTAAMLDLARGSETDLATAAAITSKTLRGFGLEADQARRVSDVLAVAATSSSTTVTELGEALKYVAPIASAADESLEDTAAALAVLANNGIAGTMAGTGLARAFKNLTQVDTQEKLHSIGVEALDSAGNLRPLIDIMDDLDQATLGIGTGKRLGIFEILFGRGQASALKISDSSLQVRRMANDMRNAGGAAKKMSDTMDDTLGGSMRMFLSAAEGAAIAFTKQVTPALRTFLGYARTGANIISQFIRENKDLAVGLLKVTGAIIGVGTALLAISASASIAAFALGGIASLAAGISAVVTPITLLAGALGIVALLAGEAFGVIDLGITEMIQSFRVGGASISAWMQVIWARIAQAWLGARDLIGIAWDSLKLSAEEVGGAIYRSLAGIAQKIAEAFWTSVRSVVDAIATLAGSTVNAAYQLDLIDDKELVAAEESLKKLREIGKEGGKGAADFYDESIADSATASEKRWEEFYKRRDELAEKSAAREKRFAGIEAEIFRRDESRPDVLREKISGIYDRVTKPFTELPEKAQDALDRVKAAAKERKPSSAPEIASAANVLGTFSSEAARLNLQLNRKDDEERKKTNRHLDKIARDVGKLVATAAVV